MLMKKIFIFLLCFIPLALFSQVKTITGKVTDSDGIGIPGVNVTLKGAFTGTITNSEGAYSIIVKDVTNVLVYSFVGMKAQEFIVGKQTVINVTMVDDSIEMETVVVVGYGLQTKESAVGSISQVDGDVLKKTGQSSISNALTGQIPGVFTVQVSGQPGADAASVYIRGKSTWGGNSPLTLVDGVEREYNDIDPNEIESISVLKDASATAVFGVRGANGVILITTKRGRIGKPTFTYSSEFSAKEPMLNRNMFDSYTTGLLVNEANRNDNNWHLLYSDEVLEHYRLQDMPYVYPNTDWGKEVMRDYGFAQKHNMNMSAGNGFARIYTSLSYLSDGDIYKTEKQPEFDPEFRYKRYNYRTNMDFNVTSSTLVSLDVGGYVGFKNGPANDTPIKIHRPMYMLGPMVVPAMYPAEVLLEYPDNMRPEEIGDRFSNTGVANAQNPLLALNNSGSKVEKTTSLNTTLKFDQKLDFITKGLSVQAKVAFNSNSGFTKTYASDELSYRLSADGSWVRYKGQATADPEGGTVPIIPSSDSNTTPLYKQWYYEASVNYKRSFNKHNVTGLVLANREKIQSGSNFPNFAEGIAARVTYNYESRYLFEFNLGINGSEKFAPANRYGYFPSLAIGYNLHQEKFFQKLVPFMKMAKIRYSYGEVGSDNAGRWLYISEYAYGTTNNFGFIPGTSSSGGRSIQPLVEGLVANTSARWERALKENLGFELGFLKNNMFLLTIDLYNEKRDGILLSRQSLPAWFGVNAKEQNLGKTESMGYELELKFTQRLNNGLNFWLKGGYNKNDNRIISRDEPPFTPEYQKQADKRIDQLFGYKTIGFIDDLDERAAAPHYGTGIYGLGDIVHLDFNGDGTINVNDRVPMGYPGNYPLVFYTFSAGLDYKGFDFEIDFQGATDMTRYLADAFKFPLHRLGNQYLDYQSDYWRPGNTVDPRYPAVHMDAYRSNNGIGNTEVLDYVTRDASYLRIKSAQLGYNIPKYLIAKTFINNLRVYLQGTNLFTWCPDIAVGDIEATDGGNGVVTSGNYPQLRRFTLGVQVSF
jgi:TonB-linked SusC/RagA family outer membrane protein